VNVHRGIRRNAVATAIVTDDGRVGGGRQSRAGAGLWVPRTLSRHATVRM